MIIKFITFSSNTEESATREMNFSSVPVGGGKSSVIGCIKQGHVELYEVKSSSLKFSLLASFYSPDRRPVKAVTLTPCPILTNTSTGLRNKNQNIPLSHKLTQKY